MIVEVRDDVVVLSGALTRNEWRTLSAAVSLRLQHHPNGIVLDCRGLTRLTAEGAETFREAIRQVAIRDARLVVVGANSATASVLRLMPDLGSRLPVAENLADARASLGLPTGRADARAEILVALLGTKADQSAVVLAAQLAGKSRVDGLRPVIHLVATLQIPRDRPLLSAVGMLEEQATVALEQLGTWLRRHNLSPVIRVERTRDRVRRLREVVEATGATMLVLGLPRGAADDLVETIRSLLAQCPCEVVFLREPQED
jgi:anti-anti-sigma regulatory factor